MPAVPGGLRVGRVPEVTAERTGARRWRRVRGVGRGEAEHDAVGAGAVELIGVEGDVETLAWSGGSPDRRLRRPRSPRWWSAGARRCRWRQVARRAVRDRRGCRTPVPAVRHAPLVLPGPAGRYHWPAAVELLANVSVSSGDPAANAVGRQEREHASRTPLPGSVGVRSRRARACRDGSGRVSGSHKGSQNSDRRERHDRKPRLRGVPHLS